MDQQRLIDAVTGVLQPDQRIRALFLAGSFGKGTADAWSDVDLLAIAAPPDHAVIAADWRGRLETIQAAVHYQPLGPALIHAVLADWSRVDLYIVAPERLAGRAQDKLKPLFDRDGLYARLPATIADPGPDKRQVASTIAQFLRVLGLSHVADGRREYEIGVYGYSLMRRNLSELMVAETGQGDTGGILHLSRLIDAERMAILTGLPSPVASRESVLAATQTIARLFIPRAKALAAKLGIEWPQAFEDATRAVLTRTLPEPYRPDW
jgi:hypothetical protein